MNRTSNRPSRTFVYASTAVAILVLAWGVFAARREWFAGDDFLFLALAQGAKNWVRIFLPLAPRPWWSYRPLTIEVFFSLCFRLFKHEPFGYLMVSQSTHFVTGVVVYRLARQFGFETRVAVLTALLSVTRYPSLTEGLWISVCQYTVTIFFYVLSLSLFIDYARGNRIAFQIASCVTLMFTLLSNEMGVSLAAVVVLTSLYLDDFSFSRDRLMRTVRRCAPHVTIAAAYVLFRTRLIGPAEVPPVYHWVVGWHILSNYFWALVFVFGADRTCILAGMVPVMAALIAVTRGAAVKPLVGVGVVSVGWIVAAMLPYVGMPFPYPRFAMSIEVPVCLLCGACFDAFSRVYSSKHQAVVESVLLAVLVVSLPYRAAWDRANNPQGEQAHRLVSLIRDRYVSLPQGTAVVVLYGSDGLGTARESEEFWARVGGVTMFWSFYTDKQLRFFLLDMSHPAPKDLKCPPCLFLDLKPGGVLEPAAREPVAYAHP